MARIFRRLPELIPEYFDRIALSDKHGIQHHGAILSTVILITEMCDLDAGVIPHFRKVRLV